MKSVYLSKIREHNPLIHNITNIVAANFSANGLLALGASPLMSANIEEMVELPQISQALVINIGTVIGQERDAMLLAGKTANSIGSNAGELATIAGEDWQAKGVDAGQGKTNLQEVAQRVAQRYGCTVLISGEVDIISDGQQTTTVHNGTPLFPKVTASGCLLSAVCAAFLAVDEGKHFSATIEACAAYTIAGEIAAKNLTMQVGQFQIRLLDELSALTPSVIEQNAEVKYV